MTIRARDFLLIPNLLSLFRLVLMPLPVALIAHGHDAAALALITVGIVTDVLDGTLARRLNQVSELGKILDPLSDKLAIAALVLALVAYKNFPWWAAALIISRDLLILLGALLALKFKRPTPTSNLFGKITALIWTLLILSYLLPSPILQGMLLALVIAVTPVSLMFYLMRLAMAPRVDAPHSPSSADDGSSAGNSSARS